MIVDESIEIKISNKTVRYYNEIGYECIVGNIINIKPEHLQRYSMVKINVKCTNCNSINTVTNNNYINKQLERQGVYVCKKCFNVKTKKTNLKKYGFEFFSQTDDFSKIVKKSSQNKWGVDNYTQTDEYKERSKQTSQNKWGVDNYTQTDEYKERSKQTLLNRYGVDNPVKVNGNNIQKRKKTNLKKYGFEHAIQNQEIFHKLHRKRKLIHDIYYDSSYELDFINYCMYNKIDLKRGPTINYIYNDKNKIYYPDFYLNEYNLICEVKSTYTYNYNPIMNKLKRESCILKGYDYLFIIDKDYNEFNEIIKKLQLVI